MPTMKRRQNGKPIELDAIDRGIIEQLQTDGRLPFTRIAQTVGLSEAAVRQRVQRLVDNEAMQIVAIINPLSLSKRRMAMIGVRVTGSVREVAGELEQLAGIEYIVITAGSFDLLCEAVVDDDDTLMTLIEQIRKSDGVLATETFVYLGIEKQTYDWGAH